MTRVLALCSACCPPRAWTYLASHFVGRLGRNGRLLRSAATARSAAALAARRRRRSWSGSPARRARCSWRTLTTTRRAAGSTWPTAAAPAPAAGRRDGGFSRRHVNGERRRAQRLRTAVVARRAAQPLCAVEKLPVDVLDHQHHLAGALLRVLVVRIVLPLDVTVGAIHAERRRDVLHRQLQLVERDVLEDLDVLRRLWTASPAAGPGRLRRSLRRSLRRLLRADTRSGADTGKEEHGRHGRERDTAEISHDHADALLERKRRQYDKWIRRGRTARYSVAEKGVGLDGNGRFVYNRRFQIGVLPSVRKWRNWQTRKPQELVTAR